MNCTHEDRFNETIDVFLDRSQVKDVLQDSCCKIFKTYSSMGGIKMNFSQIFQSMGPGVTGALGVHAAPPVITLGPGPAMIHHQNILDSLVLAMIQAN